jgi:putative DNA primase/helicase
VSAPPKAVHLIVEDIPNELLTFDNWAPWRWAYRNGKWTKVPINTASGARASSTDPSIWSPFEKAVRYARTNLLPGVGFVFTGSPFAGVDLDRCLDPETGEIEPWAQEIVEELDSYTEFSPSGRGLHVLVRAKLPEGGNRNGRIEMYDSRRFFTVTGHRLPETSAGVTERSEELAALHCRVFGAAPKGQAQTQPTDPPGGMVMDDTELVRRAKAAANGEKFRRLWTGDASAYTDGDNEGRSEADLALCSLLAFWCGPDESRIDALFRRSGLMRPKWDERRGTQTYGGRTIEQALDGRGEFWAPRTRHWRQRGTVSVAPPGPAHTERAGVIRVG